MVCPECGEEFIEGQGVDPVHRPLIVQKGEKTGVVGFYPHPDYDDDEEVRHVHLLGCALRLRHPEDSPFIYDQMMMEVREDIEEEVREEFLDELRNERPMCPWCKSLDVWTKVKAEGAIFRFCEHCRKYWDEEENEVAAA